MKEGVVAPEVWIDALGGRCATDLASLAGTAGLVNAFTVWVGVRVVVVSPAGAGLDLRRVARSLRDLLGVRETPVIQVLREHEHGVCATADHGLWSGNPGDLALAVAYVTVQCGWYEGEALEVELDGVSYHLGITMEPLGGGAYHPRVRLG